MIAGLATHLWQSTIFGIAIALLVTALRPNRARVRYRLWFAASVKFLIPLAPLMALGTQLSAPRDGAIPLASVVRAAGAIGQPLLEVPFPAATVSATTSGLPMLGVTALAVWLVGFVAILCVRLRMWRRIRAMIDDATPLRLSGVDAPARLRFITVSSLLEPAVVGIWRPMLLLPRDVHDHLTRAQLHTVIAHELSHVRHQDNLTATVHMCVEAIFWFHPGVWLIGSR
jgi:bla regulator protein blaR1